MDVWPILFVSMQNHSLESCFNEKGYVPKGSLGLCACANVGKSK